MENKTKIMAMLLELGMMYHELENKASCKRDSEEVFKLIELNDCINKLMEDIEKRF